VASEIHNLWIRKLPYYGNTRSFLTKKLCKFWSADNLKIVWNSIIYQKKSSSRASRLDPVCFTPRKYFRVWKPYFIELKYGKSNRNRLRSNIYMGPSKIYTVEFRTCIVLIYKTWWTLFHVSYTLQIVVYIRFPLLRNNPRCWPCRGRFVLPHFH
jgi:hypothetical protein